MGHLRVNWIPVVRVDARRTVRSALASSNHAEDVTLLFRRIVALAYTFNVCRRIGCNIGLADLDIGDDFHCFPLCYFVHYIPWDMVALSFRRAAVCEEKSSRLDNPKISSYGRNDKVSFHAEE